MAGDSDIVVWSSEPEEAEYSLSREIYRHVIWNKCYSVLLPPYGEEQRKCVKQIPPLALPVVLN